MPPPCCWRRTSSCLPPAAEAYVLAPKVNVFHLPPDALSVLPYVAAGSLALGVIALIAILATRSRGAAVQAARPASAVGRQPGGSRDRQLPGDLAGEGPLRRLRHGRHQRLQRRPGRRRGPRRARRLQGRAARAFPDPPGARGRRGIEGQVPAGYPPDEYRLVGKISGQAPFSGVLVHHGWKTDIVKLPRVLRSSADQLPAIAPAEVELK